MAPFNPESIPDAAEMREGLAHSFEAHRVAILGGLALLVFGSLGLLAYSSVSKDREDRLRAEYHGIVDDLERGRTLYSYAAGEAVPQKEIAADQAKRLEELRARADGSDVEPFILLQLALRYQVSDEDAKALAVLGELRTKHPDSPVLQIQAYDSETATLVDRLEGISKRRSASTTTRKVVEPRPDLSTVALVETDLGTFKIVFYPDLAPRHVAALVDGARAGSFNGTRVYTVRQGNWIELGGGDRTRNDAPRDDRDDDPAVALPPEDASRLYVKHRRRTVTSVRLLSGDQGDRFAVVLSEARADFDATNTPFGELLDDESAAVADRIGSALTYSQDAAWIGRREEKDFPNTPSRPVTIRRISIWKDGVLDKGHTWDTSRVNTDQPEPGKAEEDK